MVGVCLREEMNQFYERPPIMCDICNKQAGLKSCDESRATFLGLGKPPKSSGEMSAIKIVKLMVNKGQNNAEHYWVLCTCMYSYHDIISYTYIYIIYIYIIYIYGM